jgi:hypothetical protein
VGIEQKIPELSDKELENLHANAVRLAQSGTQQRRQQAEALLPLLVAEIDMRRQVRTQEQERRRSSTRRKAVAVAKDQSE